MNRPPRAVNELFFGRRKIAFAVLNGILLLASVLTVYGLSVREGHSDGEVRAITFSALIIGNIFLILADLSKTRSFIDVIKERSAITLLILSGAFGLLLMAVAVPALHVIFSFEHPGYSNFLPAIASAGVMLLILEIIKWFKYGRTVKL